MVRKVGREVREIGGRCLFAVWGCFVLEFSCRFSFRSMKVFVRGRGWGFVRYLLVWTRFRFGGFYFYSF